MKRLCYLTTLLIICLFIERKEGKKFIGGCNWGFCEQKCRRIDRNFMECYCNPGFELEKDGRKCTKVETQDDTVVDTRIDTSSSGESSGSGSGEGDDDSEKGSGRTIRIMTTNCDEEDGTCEEVVIDTIYASSGEGSGEEPKEKEIKKSSSTSLLKYSTSSSLAMLQPTQKSSISTFITLRNLNLTDSIIETKTSISSSTSFGKHKEDIKSIEKQSSSKIYIEKSITTDSDMMKASTSSMVSKDKSTSLMNQIPSSSVIELPSTSLIYSLFLYEFEDSKSSSSIVKTEPTSKYVSTKQRQIKHTSSSDLVKVTSSPAEAKRISSPTHIGINDTNLEMTSKKDTSSTLVMIMKTSEAKSSLKSQYVSVEKSIQVYPPIESTSSLSKVLSTSIDILESTSSKIKALELSTLRDVKDKSSNIESSFSRTSISSPSLKTISLDKVKSRIDSSIQISTTQIQSSESIEFIPEITDYVTFNDDNETIIISYKDKNNTNINKDGEVDVPPTPDTTTKSTTRKVVVVEEGGSDGNLLQFNIITMIVLLTTGLVLLLT